MKPDDGPLNPNTIWAVIGLVAALLLVAKSWGYNAPAKEPVAMLRVVTPDGVRSTHVSENECRAAKDRIWVQAAGSVECIAYVAAKSEPPSDTALVFLNGDVPDAELAKEASDDVRQANAKQASNSAQKFGMTVIIVGRPGLMGSTGFHQLGGFAGDADIITHAIDALKTKIGVRRVALAGQSGGSRLIAQILILGRSDVMCAAMGSGAYGVPRLKSGGTISTNIWGQAGRHYMVPLQEIDRMTVEKTRRLFVIGDPADRIAPFAEQRDWFNSLVARNHQALLIETSGGGTDHHGAARAALMAAANCALAKSDSEIAALIKAP